MITDDFGTATFIYTLPDVITLSFLIQSTIYFVPISVSYLLPAAGNEWER